MTKLRNLKYDKTQIVGKKLDLLSEKNSKFALIHPKSPNICEKVGKNILFERKSNDKYGFSAKKNKQIQKKSLKICVLSEKTQKPAFSFRFSTFVSNK